LSADLPILIEAVESEDKIRSVVLLLDEMVGDGPITLEKVELVAYRAERPESASGS